METSTTFFASRKLRLNNLLFDSRKGVSKTSRAIYHVETNFLAIRTAMEISKTFFALRKRNSNNLLVDLRKKVLRTRRVIYHFETNFLSIRTAMENSKNFFAPRNVVQISYFLTKSGSIAKKQ